MNWLWYEIGRVTWAFEHDTPVFLQVISALATASVTIALCWISYRYMVLTRRILRVTTEQARAAVRPIVTVSLVFQGGQGPSGAVVFKEEVVVTITNVGNAPLVIERVMVTWEHSSDVGEVSAEARGFRGVVLAVGTAAMDTVKVKVDARYPQFEHFGAWSDFVAVDVKCSYLGSVAPVGYVYQPATGLRRLPVAEIQI